ncbi:MAG TPA: glycosyltransferase family 2 protein [Opitutales bacterium]|nr:glycosyltransferase family 2 protein [Opitutales bacterium]
MNSQPELSIVIPFYNEAENAAPVILEILACQPDAEIIAVDDGSRDSTWEAIRSVKGIVAVRAGANRGQSAAVYAGLRVARGKFIGTMDGDGQNDPADFAQMLEILRTGRCDVVYGRRAKRRDSWSKRVASKAANRIRRLFLVDGVHDAGCGIKMFRREAVEFLVPFNGMHRYMAAIFTRAGLRIEEMSVNHRPRAQGTSKYTNFDRAMRGIHDLIGVAWLLKRKVHYPSTERVETE